jgi:DNA-binding SARP family transcriptional activator
MISIYSDDLLSEEIYSDWTFADRETCKSIFQETAVCLSTFYIDEKETHLAEKLLLRVMSIDPYNEDVCLILLNLYISGNQRTRAKKLYSDFERRLVKDLGIKPDERLTYAISTNYFGKVRSCTDTPSGSYT